MHEYAIVQALLQQVERAVAAHPAGRVERLWVRVGEQSGVDRDLFANAYATFRQRSVCAEAEMHITAVPARWSCPACGIAITPGHVLRCPRCAIPAQLVAGDEIILDRIEMEVSDV